MSTATAHYIPARREPLWFVLVLAVLWLVRKAMPKETP